MYVGSLSMKRGIWKCYSIRDYIAYDLSVMSGIFTEYAISSEKDLWG